LAVIPAFSAPFLVLTTFLTAMGWNSNIGECYQYFWYNHSFPTRIAGGSLFRTLSNVMQAAKTIDKLAHFECEKQQYKPSI
jgi:hypothetical protein